MYQVSQHCALVAAMVLVGAPVRAQSAPSVPVNVQPAGAVQIVLVSSNAAEKVLTTTDQKGQGSIDGAVVAKLGPLDMIEESCGSRKRVLLVASNGKVADRAGCSKRSIGTFVSGTDRTLKAELFTPLPRPASIPEPSPVTPPQQPAQRAPSAPPPSPSRPPVTGATVAARPCPPGASMVGAKLDLATDADSFEQAPLLLPCAYRGAEDTDRARWKYYKVQVEKGQTLKITARLRDAELPDIGYGDRRLFVRLHDVNGGLVGQGCNMWQPSEACVQEYKAADSGFAFISMRWVMRDAAFLIAIQ